MGMMRISVSMILLAGVMFSGAAEAQISASLCSRLLDSELIDTRSELQIYSSSNQEFTDFCSQKSNYSSRMSGRSSSFQAGFESFTKALNLGFGSSRTSGMTEQQFEKVCDRGARDFASFMQNSAQESSGAYVAEQFNDCISVLVSANQTFLTGQIKETGVDDRFIAEFKYFSGQDGPSSVYLSAINGDDIACYPSAAAATANEGRIPDDDKRWFVSGDRSITCVMPNHQLQAGGIFEFSSQGGDRFRTVDYSYLSSSVENQIRDSIAASFSGRLSEIDQRVQEIETGPSYIIPSGTVAMFELSECPVGWSSYDGLVGRVMVGATADRIGNDIGSRDVVIPRNALPKVALRLPTKDVNRNATGPQDPYVYDRHPYAVTSVGRGNFSEHERRTEFMGQGKALQLPLPLAVQFLPCIRR